jgi:hypothetical protein
MSVNFVWLYKEIGLPDDPTRAVLIRKKVWLPMPPAEGMYIINGDHDLGMVEHVTVDLANRKDDTRLPHVWLSRGIVHVVDSELAGEPNDTLTDEQIAGGYIERGWEIV